MDSTRRGWLAAALMSACTVQLSHLAEVRAEDAPSRPATDAKRAGEEAAAKDASAKDAPAALPPGALNDESLGTLLQAIGLKPKLTEARYDFTFASKHQDQEWTLSMSAVLSQDKKTIWIMAWLDELPRSAKDVPRSALLSLLAENDKMGKGMFFSYIPGNRRFALQQVVENRDMTSKKVRSLLLELGQNVSQTYPQWTVANWKDLPSAEPGEEQEGPQQASGATPSNATPPKAPVRPAAAAPGKSSKK